MIFVIQMNFRLGTIKEVITSCSMFCYTFVKVLKEYDTLSGPCSGSTVFIMMEAERTDKTENCLVRYAGLLRQIVTRSRPYKTPQAIVCCIEIQPVHSPCSSIVLCHITFPS